MRISDWSSDVCSSDLVAGVAGAGPTPTELARSFSDAVAHHFAGRLREAQAIYRQLLRHFPNHPELLDLYGTLRHQLGDHGHAAELVARSVARRPAAAGGWNHFGAIQRALDRRGPAIVAFRRSALLAPSEAGPWINLGIVANDLGDYGKAVGVGRSALAVRPALVDVRVKVGAETGRVHV